MKVQLTVYDIIVYFILIFEECIVNKAQLREQWIEFLGTIVVPGAQIDKVDDNVNLVEAGLLDSLAVIQIIVRVEQEHGANLLSLNVDPNELATIGGILDTIERIIG